MTSMSPDPGIIFKDQTYYCASSYRTISITVTLHSTSTVGIKCLVHCPGTQRLILILSSSTKHYQLLHACKDKCALIFDVMSCNQACYLFSFASPKWANMRQRFAKKTFRPWSLRALNLHADQSAHRRRAWMRFSLLKKYRFFTHTRHAIWLIVMHQIMKCMSSAFWSGKSRNEIWSTRTRCRGPFSSLYLL